MSNNTLEQLSRRHNHIRGVREATFFEREQWRHITVTAYIHVVALPNSQWLQHLVRGPLSFGNWRMDSVSRDIPMSTFKLEVKMWKLSHTDVCDCGERQPMSHLMTCGDASNCTWADLAMPTLACSKHREEAI